MATHLELSKFGASSPKPNVMFFHGKTSDKARFTISGTLENNILTLGIAVCGDNEQFTKEKGRSISTGRLLNQRHSELGGRIQLQLPVADQERKTFTAFTDTVSNYNYYTKKKLLKEFGLRKTTVLSDYEQKRIEILKEFAIKLRELNEAYHK